MDIADVVSLLQTGAAKARCGLRADGAGRHDSLQYLTDGDVRAMAVYLKVAGAAGRGEEPVQIRPTEQQSKALYEQGAKLYDSIAWDCHQANGTGVPPAYPSLANNQSIAMEFAANPIRMVMFAAILGHQGQSAPIRHAAVCAGAERPRGPLRFVTYIRQSWATARRQFSSADVARYRAVPLE